MVRLSDDADLQLDLRLESVLEGVLVSGTVRGVYTGECVRCLDPVDGAVTADIQELFVYPDVEREQDEDEDEPPRLVRTLIDLEPVVRDALVLALPLQPVCSEDCRGLCQGAGCRLADDPEHQHERIDPRWAALQDALPLRATDLTRGEVKWPFPSEERHAAIRAHGGRSGRRSAPALVRCQQCRDLKLPHVACPTCGTYNRRPVVEV